jgi:DNA (cytosine-5)-methyltransferase 1
MSYGFHAHPLFKIVGAADAQLAKPSSGPGKLDCNATYELNIGLRPLNVNLGDISPCELASQLQVSNPTVLIACAPCTGFSRANSNNHVKDDARNSLVARSASFVEQFRPEIFLMENARELLKGNFTHHFEYLRSRLVEMGYAVSAEIHFLDRFGLPQRRERALVIATKLKTGPRTLTDLWSGYSVNATATTVRYAIQDLPIVGPGETHVSDPFHTSPMFGSIGAERLRYIPHDGGSWIDLANHEFSERLLTPAMKRYISKGDFGSHPDVYGRLWWDRPAVTIKRECGHTGNGRYAHPVQDRLCTVREMAILQGFPKNYVFSKTSVGNMYRHIGDAVPPLISYQLAKACEWMLSGERPPMESLILPKTHISSSEVIMRGPQSELALY